MPDYELRKCEFHLYRDKSTTDTTQVPMAGATLSVHRQGVIVRSQQVEIDEQESAEVEVEDGRFLQVGDVLVRDSPVFAELLVTAIAPGRTRITVQNLDQFVGLAAGERLRCNGPSPTLFQDPRGHVPYTSAPVANSYGYAFFYALVPAVDVVVTGGGLNGVRYYLDQRTGWIGGGDSWLNAREFGSIQAAIDALPASGGTVFIPSGTYTLTETLYTPCDRPCHLVGEGAVLPANRGTTLQWSSNVGMVRLRGDQSSLRSMNLVNVAEDVATAQHLGFGVMIGRRDIADAHPHPGTSTTLTEHLKFARQPLKGMLIEDVTIKRSRGWGLTIPGHGVDSVGAPEHGLALPGVEVDGVIDGGTLSFWVTMNRVKVDGPGRYGAYFTGGGCTTLWFNEGALLNAQEAVERDENGQPIAPYPFYACLRGTVKAEFNRATFEGNSNPGVPELDPLVGQLPAVGDVRPWVSIKDCESILLESCYFENDPHWVGGGSTAYWPTYFIHLEGSNRSIHIRAPHFVRNGKNRGRLRCLLCEHNSVHGLELHMPYAISVTRLTTPVTSTIEAMIDKQAVVLARPGQSNTGIVVCGRGNAWDAEPSEPNPIIGRLHPLWITGAPAEATWISDVSVRVPTSSAFERDGVLQLYAEMNRVNGALTADSLNSAGEVGALLYWWGGISAGWRLVNNVPTLNPAQIAGRDYVDGDMVIDSNALKLFIRFGGVWKQVASLL